jgi:hypothetical protein
MRCSGLLQYRLVLFAYVLALKHDSDNELLRHGVTWVEVVEEGGEEGMWKGLQE